MTGVRIFVMAVVLMGGLAGTAGAGEPVQVESLRVGADPSLKAAFQKIIPMFEQEYGATVHVIYGPSAALRRQIEQGAPIDVFLPGAAEEVEALDKKGLTFGKPRIYAQTPLVLVMSAASPATAISFYDVLPNGATRIAIADPKTSALGKITARALAKLDQTYTSRLHLLPAPHTGDILNLVHAGAADVGIVYRADALNGGELRLMEVVPGDTMVRFGAAVVWTCQKASLPVAQKFLDFIVSTRIQKLLLHYGFEPVASNGPGTEIENN